MPMGPGKYDDICTEVREKTYAVGAMIIIIDGNRGWGFSVQAPPWELLKLSKALRAMADQIEDGLKEGKII